MTEGCRRQGTRPILDGVSCASHAWLMCETNPIVTRRGDILRGVSGHRMR